MPIAYDPWGNYFGMFADKFGVQWMVGFDSKYNGQKYPKKNNKRLTGAAVAL